MREEIQKEAVETALKHNSGCLAIPVRSGKTLIGLTLASNFNKVLVSYPNLSIKESWVTDSQKFNISIENITFTTHLSLNKYNLDGFDIVILDEIDQVSEAQWTYIADYPYCRLYGLSGTVPLEGSLKRSYINTFCPVIYEIKLDKTVGILQKDYQIIVHMLNPSEAKDIPLSKGGFWSEKAKIQFWENKANKSHNFMDTLKVIQAIQNSKTKLSYLKQFSTKLDRCLIFLETIEQCKELDFPTYHSKTSFAEGNLKLFQDGDFNKLTCVKQLSAGISFKNLSKAIILHCYASNNKFHQRFGRILNLVDNTEIEAEIHLLCLKGTKDELWVKKGLAEFDQSKITYKTIQ